MAYIESKNAYKLGETPEDWKEILELETEAIRELLKFVGEGLLSGIIRIHGKIEAVTLGEFARTNSKETVLVHVEKADDRIRGLYQAINHEFCLRLPEETVYVNREEDMGPVPYTHLDVYKRQVSSCCWRSYRCGRFP